MSGVRRVIVGASGSPGSLRALRYAEDLARHSDAMLIPVLAWAPPGGDLAERRAPCPALRELWQESARQRLADALAMAWGGTPAGLTVRPLVERGEPGPVLVDVAYSGDDLLVVGAGRRGTLRRFRSGRVSYYCLSHARCPVLAIPPADLADGLRHGLRGWGFRRRELTVDQALDDRGRAAA